jgi:RNA polymerase sigma-70 factor, ECF subfamily
MKDFPMFEELLERVRRKDRKAQHEFYQRYSVQMFRLTYRYITDEQDAGSIVNMAFFKIFDHIREFNYQDQKSMLAWIKKIVINESLMFLRQRFTYVELEGNLTNDLFIESRPEDNLILEDYYKLIRKLPDDLRTVFNLFALDGFSHKEIARQLNIKEARSRVYLTRARKMLQNYLIKSK